MKCLCCNGDGSIWQASEVPSIECHYCKKTGEIGILKYLCWKLMLFENVWFKIIRNKQ